MGVRSYLAAQVAAAVAADRALRTEEGEAADAVHDARVAVRRVRSVLRIFPELGDDGVADALAAWSDRLGTVREAEVLAATLADACPAALAERVVPEVQAERAASLTALTAELISAEHRGLLADLEALALRQPEKRLHKRRRVRHADKVARKRLRSAGEDPVLLHRARKAAKRARYAAEAAGDGERAGRWEDVQDALGAHHDCVIALRRLDSLPDGDDVEQARQVLREHAADALARLRSA